MVVGDGPERARVQAAAAGAANISFPGTVSQSALIGLMQRARAFVFAAEEDFGITLAEAQACGTPVIAYGHGGAADIVPASQHKPTGVLFDQQSPAALTRAIARFEALEAQITPDACRANAQRFSQARFRAQLTFYLTQAWESYAA